MREGYFLLEGVFVVDEVDVVEHGLVVDGGEPGDDLHEEVEVRVRLRVVGRQQLQNVPVEVECVLQIGYLVLELVVLLPQVVLIHHSLCYLHYRRPVILNSPCKL